MGELEFTHGMLYYQFNILEKKHPELLSKRVGSKRKKPRQRVDRNAENRDQLDEAEGFEVEEIEWRHEELKLLDELASDRQALRTISIANAMNANVASKKLPKVRDCEYTEQMIRDNYEYMRGRGWEFPILKEAKPIEKGSSRSAGHGQSRRSRPVNEPSVVGSLGSHGQQQNIPTFMAPSQESIMAVAGPPDSYLQHASLLGIGAAVGPHGHQGSSQHISLPGIHSVLGPHVHRGVPQQINTPAQIGTSSSQNLHAGAQHPSRHLPPPSSG